MNRSRIPFALALLLLVAAGSASAAENLEFTLRFAEFSFDPLQAEPELPAGWSRSNSSGPDLHLVQFNGPIPEGALEKLRARGMEPVQYVHPNTYIVWGRGSDRVALNRELEVRWTGDFAPAYRVQPQWRNLKTAPVHVRVLLYRGADPDAAVKAIETLGGALEERLAVTDRLEIAGFVIPGDRIRDAASLPGVYSIQPTPTDGGSRGEISAQINAGNVDAGGIALPGYPAWLATVGLSGAGVTVADVDEGVDETHVDLVASMLGCVGASCSTQSSVHGTFTAGIVVGDAVSAVVDANGFLRGQGVAPGASLIEQRYYPTMLKATGMLELMTDSVSNGAIVSNNSWGPSGATLGYDADTLLVDAGVRDADPGRPGNQPLFYVQAIANGDGGVSSQGVPDDAKNSLVVGATMAIGADGNPDPGHDNLASVTAHGPALDGRTTPHLVAPGCWVDSTAPGDQHLGRCGTSYAAPQVAGAAALFIERFQGLAGSVADPSPALIKAALLAVAHDLDGFNDADGATMGHRPDSKQGWGRLNLAAVVDPPAASVLYLDEPWRFEFSGDEWIRSVVPVDPGQPMRVMLVWTDAPGHGLGGPTPAWNNDLDLVVEAEGTTYLGNQFGTDGFSAIGGTADGMNNAEAVFLQGLSGSAIDIRVLATNINSDGVPGNEAEIDQDFALVCYNCAYVPAFALNVDAVVQNVCAPEDGSFAIEVESLSSYANPVTLSVTGVPAGALESFDVNPATPGQFSVLTIVPGATPAGDYPLTVDGVAVDMSHSIDLELRLRTAAPAPTALSLPADQAVGVHPQPVLEWSPASWPAQYVVELSTDPTFTTLLYSARTSGTSHSVRSLLGQQATYYWRVRATNVCGFGSFSATWSFTTGSVPDVLLVDDDWDLPDVQGDYTSALNALGVSYDLWDVYAVHGGLEPDPRTLAPYSKVIWFSGREEVYSGPDLDSEAALADWLDRARCLHISAADYVLNSSFSPFIQQRLGVASADEDTGQDEVTGQGVVYGGLGLYSLQNLPNDYSDSLTPDATAELAFQGDLGPAGVNKDTGTYRAGFTGFGLERLSAGNLQNVIGAHFGWCDVLPGLDGDADGVLNGDDCAPADAAAWTTPLEVTGLLLGKGGGHEFFWTQPVSGSGAEYDVLRSVDPLDFWNATCVGYGVNGTSTWGDTDPSPGELWFYQVGARSECGVSTLGTLPDTSPRHGTACE